MVPKIVVVGSSNTDMILKLDHIPRPGETRLGGEFLTAPGGKGANQAVAAASAGGAVTFIARVGQDMFGEQAVAGLVEKGVNIDYVRFDRAPSGVALIFVSDEGENSIGVASGANAELSPPDVRQAESAFDDAKVVVLQLESPLETVQAAVEMARAKGVLTVLNPAPAQPLPQQLLESISILTPNETETEALTGIVIETPDDCASAADALMEQGVACVIITLGARGAYVATAKEKMLVPGFAVKQVDTTAAGDTFNGALAVAVAEGRPIVEAVRFANAAAAVSVTRMGAQPSAPSREEIEALLASQPILSFDGATDGKVFEMHVQNRATAR
jgi:ribokinase